MLSVKMYTLITMALFTFTNIWGCGTMFYFIEFL